MSDNSYFNMVLAVPCEAFVRWDWQAGDRGILLGDGREVMVVNTNLQIKTQKLLTLTFIFPYANNNNYEIAGKRDIVPVPSIAQLQQMSGYPWKTFDDLCCYEVCLLRKTYKKPCFIAKEMAGLAVVMRSLYNKKWNGSKWIYMQDNPEESDL